MHDEVIAHMRERILQLRRVIELAHDPRMIEAIEKVIGTIESDLKTLEADSDGTEIKA